MAKEWSQHYSINHPKIDRQHQQLFELARCIHSLDETQCCKEKVSKILKELFEHMREHFEEEERYMLSFTYPKFEMHQKEHEALVESITRAVKETKSMVVLQKKMKEFSDDMVTHVIDSDVQIGKWRKAQSVNLEELQAI